MDCGNEGDQRADVDRSLPAVLQLLRLSDEENGSSHHGDRDDPERNRDRVVRIEEAEFLSFLVDALSSSLDNRNSRLDGLGDSRNSRFDSFAHFVLSLQAM